MFNEETLRPSAMTDRNTPNTPRKPALPSQTDEPKRPNMPIEPRGDDSDHPIDRPPEEAQQRETDPRSRDTL